MYFAWLREELGRGEEEIALPNGVDTVGGLLAWLRGRDGGERALAPGRRVRCAVNQAFADEDAVVAPGDEIAFFPPVTGG